MLKLQHCKGIGKGSRLDKERPLAELEKWKVKLEMDLQLMGCRGIINIVRFNVLIFTFSCAHCELSG